MKGVLNNVVLHLICLRKAVGSSCFCFVLFSFCLSVSQAQDGIIKGRVTGNDIILENATVSVAGQVFLTNISGEFSFTVIPGIYILTITHVGYKKAEQVVEVVKSQTLFLSINMITGELLAEAVVLGSRSYIQRSNLNTTAPVDLISSKELKQTGQQSLIQMLNFAAPSMNTSRQNLFEPITLRGLSPDHSLILLNGTRYHNSAYINSGAIRGMLGKGAVSNDLNSIPLSAIEKIEMLRDGATAQYGSDAIGGVINIELKESIGKTAINFQAGQHYKGDGEAAVLGINRGIKIGRKDQGAVRPGFLNFSGDLRFREETHRGGVYTGTVYTTNKVQDDSLIQARGFNRKQAVSNDGSIPLSSLGFLVNGGYPVSGNIEIFGTGAATYRHASWPGTYRFPKNTNAVNTFLYPNGFKSLAIANTWDISGIVGVKGKTRNGWHWEWNNVYGGNTNKQLAENSNNASQTTVLEAKAPTEFYGGRVFFMQEINTISFAKDLASKIKGVKSFNLGLGLEHRFEKFRTWQGEEASWKNYDSSGKTLGGTPGSAAISPGDVVNKSRHIAGLYVDLETDITDRFLIDAAGRYEYYNSFGSNLTGKLAMRYKLSSRYTLRGSFSNGYHAPGLQQIYYGATGSAWKNSGGVLYQVWRGLFSNKSYITRAFGVKSLQPEKAINIGTGFTAAFSSHISLTVDGYWIQIKDRIVLSGIFDKANNTDVARILKNNPEIDQVQFITNAINTRSRGIDIIMNGVWQTTNTNFRVTMAANFNRTNLFGEIQSADSLSVDSQNTNTLFNREERVKIEKGQPASKIILSGNYTIGKTGFLLRATRFGKTSYAFGIDDKSRDEFFSAKILTDVSVMYSPKKWFTITLGANNVLDVYPDKLKNSINTNEGILIYSNESSPFGYNGGYYFLSMSLNF